MNNEAVLAFFDRLAPLWDSDMIRPEEVIRQILDGAGVGPGDRVLDDPMDCSPPGSSVHGDSPGKNTEAGCHALLQGIFPTQDEICIS